MSEAPEPDDGMLWFQVQQEQTRQEARSTLARLGDRLREEGVEEVRIAYDSYGDSGVVQEVTATAAGQPVELDPQTRQELGDAACELLPDGWEINEGSFGELVLDTADRRLVREHSWRVETTEYEEEELPL